MEHSLSNLTSPGSGATSSGPTSVTTSPSSVQSSPGVAAAIRREDLRYFKPYLAFADKAYHEGAYIVSWEEGAELDTQHSIWL